jgi:HYR domain-containing protein
VGVSCAPDSGSTFPVGTSTVRCAATDDAGNSASASFQVTVTLDQQSDVYTAQWGEPITAGKLDANQGRTVPLKLRLFVNGVERISGDAALSIVPCGGGTPYVLPLTFSGGRWTAKLDTSLLQGGCNTATAMLDGHAAGSFEIDVHGADPAPTTAPGDGKPPKDKPKK